MIQFKSILLRHAGLGAAALLCLGTPGVALAKSEMTPEKIKEYYALFNKGDPKYVQFIAEDAVFPHISGKVFRGRKEILAYYHSMMNTGFREERIPTMIVIDNERGHAAVELKFRIWAEGVAAKLPDGREIKPGEIWEGASVLFYDLNKDGLITSIRGAASGPGPVKKVN